LKKHVNQKGYILLEIMVLCLFLFMIATYIFAFVTWEHRVAVRQLERTRNFYTSVSAIRMIEAAVLEEEVELAFTDQSYDKTWGTLQFFDDEYEVQIPIAVWMEQEGEELVIYAEAGSEDMKERVSLTMHYEDGWYPVRYESYDGE